MLENIYNRIISMLLHHIASIAINDDFYSEVTGVGVVLDCIYPLVPDNKAVQLTFKQPSLTYAGWMKIHRRARMIQLSDNVSYDIFRSFHGNLKNANLRIVESFASSIFLRFSLLNNAWRVVELKVRPLLDTDPLKLSAICMYIVGNNALFYK